MRRPRALATMTIVVFLLGFMVVTQLRAQDAAGGLQQLSAQDLTQLIANLNVRNGQLRAEADGLETQLRSISQASANGQVNVGQLQDDLQRLRLWGGLDTVQGRGVVVTISGPITANAVNDLLDELRLAGAEALEVGDVRVVAGTVVGGDVGALSAEGTQLPDGFQLRAIGSPAALQAILERSGGIVSRIIVAQPDVSVDVAQSQGPIELPATRRDLVPVDGQPRN
ncbi:MAG: DUF881 domain-containing protein [Candidatus Limnocylindrales bacterium]